MSDLPEIRILRDSNGKPTMITWDDPVYNSIADEILKDINEWVEERLPDRWDLI